jgi:phosphoribosylformylglycinamidine cyclo-ligase
MTSNDKPLTYAAAGVDAAREEAAMSLLGAWVKRSFELRGDLGRVLLPLGHFANVVDIGSGMGLALSTDSVGTKILIAEMMGVYDTVGIDCVAMNVNDLICIGAEPIAFMDCIAIEEPRADLLEAIGRGLYEGARLARTPIPGGEVAQVGEMLRGAREGFSFDLVGTAVGIVRHEDIILGRDIEEGDAVVGVASSGIHSNGFTLARRALFDIAGLTVEDYNEDLGRTLGEELLEPTRIYVPHVMAMLERGLRPKSIAHITSDGLTNLTRIESDFGFAIDYLPPVPPIFHLIELLGRISNAEMYSVYNMGVGLCVVVAPEDADQAMTIAEECGDRAYVIGRAVPDPEKKVILHPVGLVGKKNAFSPSR